MASEPASMGGTPNRERTTAVPWHLSLVALVLAVAVVFVPTGLWPYYVGLIVLLAVGLACAAVPSLLLYFVIITSALSGLLRAFESLKYGGGGVSLSGFRWAFVFALAMVLLAINARSVKIPRVAVPFLIFAGWAAARFLITPLGPGAKDVVFYALPPILGLYTLFVARATAGGIVRPLEHAFLHSVSLPILIYLILFAVGQVRLTAAGPEGLIGPRAVAAYLLVVLSLSLAVQRYGDTESERSLGALVSFVAVLTIFFTLSRTASATALALVVISRANPRRPARLVVRGLVVVGLVVVLMWNIPFFRERSFHRVDAGLTESVSQFNTMGRAVMWPLVFGNALSSPLIGSGPGGARLALVRLRPKGEEEEHHPHNEYLQVFHDLGLVGLALLLWAWTVMIFRRWSGWSHASAAKDRASAKWNLAGTLALGAALLPAVTGNTFHYSFVMGPVFILLFLAEYMSSPVVGATNAPAAEAASNDRSDANPSRA